MALKKMDVLTISWLYSGTGYIILIANVEVSEFQLVLKISQWKGI